MMLKKGIAQAAVACAGMMLAGAALAAQPAATKPETVSGGRYGPVTVTKPSGGCAASSCCSRVSAAGVPPISRRPTRSRKRAR